MVLQLHYDQSNSSTTILFQLDRGLVAHFRVHRPRFDHQPWPVLFSSLLSFSSLNMCLILRSAVNIFSLFYSLPLRQDQPQFGHSIPIINASSSHPGNGSSALVFRMLSSPLHRTRISCLKETFIRWLFASVGYRLHMVSRFK